MEDNKKIYCSKIQKETLIELLKKDPQLIFGKFTSSFTFREARNRWTAIAENLNALPGCIKDWSQWKRTWQDSRTKVRGKKSMMNRHLNGTGGGPQMTQKLTPIDNQILELVNPITIDGDENISMPVTTFEFSDFDINNAPLELDRESSNDNMNNYENPIFTIQSVEETNCTNDDAIATIGKKCDRKKIETLTTAKRLTNSLAIGKDICEIGQQKLNLKESYYEKKLALLERKTVALENIAAAVKSKWLD